MSDQSLKEIKSLVCQSGKQLLAEGLVARTWGNVSVRLNDREMIITPSGRKYEDLTPDDMVQVSYIDYKYDGHIKPSSELKLHGEIYKRRPEIHAVIHTHQMYASIVAAAQVDVEVQSETYRKILGGAIVHAAPYALPNTKKITMATADALGSHNAAIMANHGVVCCGPDLASVFEVCRTLEAACKEFLEKHDAPVL